MRPMRKALAALNRLRERETEGHRYSIRHKVNPSSMGVHENKVLRNNGQISRTDPARPPHARACTHTHTS